MQANIVCRRAEPEDADWLIGQLKEFSISYGSRHPLFGDEAQVRAGLMDLVHNHFIWMAERKGDKTRLGFIAGMLNCHVFNPNIRVLTELMWWVIPEARGTRAAGALFDRFVRFGQVKAQWITFGLGSHTKIKERSILRQGFRRQETSYLMEVW